jgi:hypothetical protein
MTFFLGTIFVNVTEFVSAYVSGKQWEHYGLPATFRNGKIGNAVLMLGPIVIS